MRNEGVRLPQSVDVVQVVDAEVLGGMAALGRRRRYPHRRGNVALYEGRSEGIGLVRGKVSRRLVKGDVGCHLPGRELKLRQGVACGDMTLVTLAFLSHDFRVSTALNHAPPSNRTMKTARTGSTRRHRTAESEEYDVPRSEAEVYLETEEASSAILTRRQEQNRAAQKAFRERRAKMLRSLEERIGRVETMGDVIGYHARRIGELEEALEGVRHSLHVLQDTVETLILPSWTLASGNDEAHPSKTESRPTVVLGALRPTSVDPTLPHGGD